MRSDLFRAATARQIARELAGLDPGPGFDVKRQSAALVPAVSVDEINWNPSPAETIPSEGGNLRASTIGYREIAQAGFHALYRVQHEHDQLADRHHCVLDELRELRRSSGTNWAQAPPTSAPIGANEPARKQAQLPLSGLPSLPGLPRVRGL